MNNKYILRGTGFFASFRGLKNKMSEVAFSKASVFGDMEIAEALAAKHNLKVVTITADVAKSHNALALAVNAQC